MFQGQPVQKFHDDKRLTSVLSDFVNCADIRMIERRGSTCLTSEPFQSLRVLGYILWQEFQGDEAPKLGVLSLVNDAHAATA